MRLHCDRPKGECKAQNFPAIRAAVFAALAVPLISFCASESNAIVRRDPYTPDNRTAATASASSGTSSNNMGALSLSLLLPSAQPMSSQNQSQNKKPSDCFFSGSNFYFKTPDGAINAVGDLLKTGERSLGIGCKEQYAFVLIKDWRSTNLVIVYGMNSIRPPGADPSLTYTKQSLYNIMTAPLSSWTQSQDKAFIIATNRMALSISFPFRGQVMTYYDLPFDTAKTQVVLIDGWVIVANNKRDIGVIRDDLQTQTHYRISSRLSNPLLKSDGRTASFGTQSSPEVEISLDQNNAVIVKERGSLLQPLQK